jgi:two-component system response regulator TtrR
MAGRSGKLIYVCEKKPRFRAMLETSLTPDTASVSGFSQHRECLEMLGTKPCDLLIVDLEGYESEGLNVLEQARRIAPWISSLAIVEHAAVPRAIQAIKAGAGDCLDKPVQEDRLLAAVQMQLARVDPFARRRPRALTRMEVQILQLILAGKTSYDIAAEMSRSKRTIDVHRKNIMRKLQATCLVDLIKRALGMGFAGPPEPREEEPGPQGQEREQPPA